MKYGRGLQVQAHESCYPWRSYTRSENLIKNIKTIVANGFYIAYNMSACSYTNVREAEIKMTDVFKALSDETRLRILSLILNGEMCVCEIEDCLGLTQSNASRHLTALKNAGILSSSKQAQWAYYKMNGEFCNENRELINYLTEKLKSLSTYESDNRKREKCKQSDLCNKMRSDCNE